MPGAAQPRRCPGGSACWSATTGDGLVVPRECHLRRRVVIWCPFTPEPCEEQAMPAVEIPPDGRHTPLMRPFWNQALSGIRPNTRAGGVPPAAVADRRPYA